jgi:hypothetical protein
LRERFDGSPQSTRQGQGSGDERKKNLCFQSLKETEFGFGIPVKRNPELSLDRKLYQHLYFWSMVYSRKK